MGYSTYIYIGKPSTNSINSPNHSFKSEFLKLLPKTYVPLHLETRILMSREIDGFFVTKLNLVRDLPKSDGIGLDFEFWLLSGKILQNPAVFHWTALSPIRFKLLDEIIFDCCQRQTGPDRIRLRFFGIRRQLCSQFATSSSSSQFHKHDSILHVFFFIFSSYFPLRFFRVFP